MGTSASSSGPGAGVSFDPTWLDNIDIPDQLKPNGDNEELNQQETNPGTDIVEWIAPKARFGSARKNLGEYIRSGNKDYVYRALGRYSKSGMGGARNVARRMRVSTKVAANFFSTFRALKEDHSLALGIILSELQSKGASATQIVDVIINHICPSGGSLDEVSCRDSGTMALSAFMEQNPDVNICNLDDDQIWTLTAMFLSNEVFCRVQMDIGQIFERQNITCAEIVTRLNEMRDYIQSEIASQLNNIRNSVHQHVDMNQLFQDVIKNTFEVFEVKR